jgi:hypothetical protein
MGIHLTFNRIRLLDAIESCAPHTTDNKKGSSWLPFTAFDPVSASGRCRGFLACPDAQTGLSARSGIHCVPPTETALRGNARPAPVFPQT